MTRSPEAHHRYGAGEDAQGPRADGPESSPSNLLVAIHIGKVKSEDVCDVSKPAESSVV